MEAVVTNEFRNTASAYGQRRASEWLGRRWWTLALPLALAAIASMWDWRFLIAGLAVVLIAYPSVLAFVFYSNALSPQSARQAVMAQEVEFSCEGIEVRYKSVENEPEHWNPPVPQCICRQDVESMELDGKWLVVKYRHEGRVLAIDVPCSAFRHQDDMRKAIEFFASKANK